MARALVFDLFPILRAAAADLGHAVGGRAADAGDRPGPDVAPQLLLLDEPSVGLAPRVNEQLFAAFARLKQLGVAIIVAEQLVKLACNVADEAVVMHIGRVAMAGNAAEVSTTLS